ncbi:MAG: MFS transporter [Dermatophilaceae bacterium]
MAVSENVPRSTVAERTTQDLVKAAVSGWLGTALEFMDFQLYSLAAALVFNKIFFPTASPAVAIIASMTTYGVGYLSRPLGAWYFGRLGDKIGRTRVLFYTIGLMGMATTLIGVLPTYDSVGVLAPILLMILRLVQGFGAGAEIAGASVMLAEYAPTPRRGAIASLVALGTNSGTLGASAIWGILVATLSEEQLIAWGWRIPFLASFLLMVFAVWIRLRLKESPVFEERADVVGGVALSNEEFEDKLGHTPGHTVQEAEKYDRWGKAWFVAFFLRLGQAGNSGLIQTYLISYLVATLLMARSVSTNAVIISSIVGFLTIPLVGFLSDRVGRRRMYLIMTTIALVVVIPTMLLINSGIDTRVLIGYIVLHNVSVLALASLENLTMAEIFGSRHRYQQMALAKELAAIVATGAGPVIAAAFTAMTGSWWPLAAMIIFFTASALIAAWIMPEVAGRDLHAYEDAL